MRAPPYHLRPNKAADRFAFIEAITRLGRLADNGLTQYTYFGFGGPYLEDFRLLYEYCAEIQMMSFEIDEEVYKRQKMHLPCRKLKLRFEDMSSFIKRYDPGESKSVFWLDYTKLRYEYFSEFVALLGTVSEYSMIKITLRAEPQQFWVFGRPPRPRKREIQDFRERFEDVLPHPDATPSKVFETLACQVQEMVRMASEQAFPPSATNMVFVPVSSFCYSDSTGIFTLTGVVCDKANSKAVFDAFGDWEFANLTWNPPKLISVPVLSTQERLHLQRLLPTKKNVGKRLRTRLGYLIEENIEDTEDALEQYATFHRYSPYFIRGTP